jgi:hypothetical protein
MTNTVTPKITTDAEIWFDPAAGTEKPTKVLFSMTQTDAGGFPYSGGGTITRDKGNIELYRDDKCTQPLVFSENQARVTNAELKTVNPDTSVGLIAWIKGTKSTDVVGVPTVIKLQLDLLERSERKKTDFNTLVKSNTIDVANADAGAKKELTIKAAGVATPTLLIGAIDNPDTRVFSDKPTPVVFGFTEVANESATTYDGDGEVTLEPKDAKLGIYKDEDCTQPLVITDGKAAIAKASLKVKLYLKAAGDAAPGMVKLTLGLKPASDPKKFAVQAPVTQAATLARVNAVTASLGASIPDALDGAVWYPSPTAVDPPSIAIKVAQTQKDDAPYGGDAVLKRDKAGLELYRDKELTKPVPFFGHGVVIANAELVRDEGLVLYLAGTETADVQLTLTLYDPKQRALKIGDPKQLSFSVKPVNRVAARIAYGAAAIPARLAPVSVFITQSNPGAAVYEKSGTLRRANTDLALFTDRDQAGAGRDPVFSGSDLAAQVSPTELVKTDKAYWLAWQGANPPDAGVTAGLTLELPASAKPYVVTDPVQLRLAVPSAPLAPIGGSTTVTPKIETEYDLVLLATTDSKPETRTSPVRARLYVDRGTPKVAYTGDATLTRDSDKLRVFLDADCSVEMSFSSNNVAVIPNAALLDKDKLYYLKGTAAGKVKLTLTPAKPSNGFESLPPVSVGAAVSKDLAVVALDLTVYRDDGEAKPSPTANTVALTKAEQRTRGRFVHLQDSGKYGRAKLVLKKVETGDWPGSADQHQIHIAVTATADRIRLYKGAAGTDLVAKYDSPAKLDKGAAGSLDTPLWAEGQAVSDDVNDVRIDVGISRTDDSGFKDTKPLRNGDWAVMTSVKIVEVKPSAADWKQFVNIPPDYTKDVNDNGDEVKKGRHILITARLDPPKANIGVDFMLWGFDGNGDADIGTPRVQRVPDALKAEAGHVTSVSSAAGLATARIKLSRYGGDKFYAVAFLADDAANGETELGKKGDTAPDNTKSKRIEVWQKIFYTLSAMRRHVPPGGSYAPRADVATFEAKFTPAFIKAEQPPGAVVTLFDHEATTTFLGALGIPTLPVPAERTVDVGLLDIIADGGPAPVPLVLDNLTSQTPSWGLFGLYDPADWLVSNSGTLQIPTQPDVAIADNRFDLEYDGPARYRLSVDISGLVPIGVVIGTVVVRLELKNQPGPSGFSVLTRTFVGLRTREQTALRVGGYDATASCVHTMHHEVGHYLGLTSQMVPDPNPLTLNRYWYQGASGGPTDYNILAGLNVTAGSVPAEIGVGGHCKYDRTDFHQARLESGKLPDDNNPICIMFHMLTTPVTTDFCPNCIRVLRGRDLSSPPLDSRDDF